MMRAAGTAFHRTSQVNVESVTFQEGDAPEVAYLITCRTHQLTRPDRPQGGGILFPNHTIRATDVMRWDNSTWKLASRGNFTIDPPGGCA